MSFFHSDAHNGTFSDHGWKTRIDGFCTNLWSRCHIQEQSVIITKKTAFILNHHVMYYWRPLGNCPWYWHSLIVLSPLMTRLICDHLEDLPENSSNVPRDTEALWWAVWEWTRPQLAILILWHPVWHPKTPAAATLVGRYQSARLISFHVPVISDQSPPLNQWKTRDTLTALLVNISS